MTEEIIAALRSLDLSDGGSHSRLSAIAACFLEPAFGWTRGACEELRNMLIKLLEDADGNDDYDHAHDCNCNHHCCDQRQMSYDELGTTLSNLYGIWQDGEESENRGSESAHKMTKSAEIGKSCVDSTSDQSHESNPMRQENETRITDELRNYLGENGQEYDNFKGEMIGSISGGLSPIYAIADRIDEQEHKLRKQRDGFRREHQEAVNRLMVLVRQRDELRVKLKEIGDIVNG